MSKPKKPGDTNTSDRAALVGPHALEDVLAGTLAASAIIQRAVAIVVRDQVAALGERRKRRAEPCLTRGSFSVCAARRSAPPCRCIICLARFRSVSA
jgi:hypothetical protein